MATRFPVPWGLFAALGVYAGLVTGYIAYTYWTSPEYQASEQHAEAWQILGRDEGRHCSERDLERAYDHVLRAAQLLPSERKLHEELESLAWRFDERHWKVPAAMLLGAQAQSARWAELQADNAPRFASGLHERGWDPQGLLAGPAQSAKWALLGAGLIVVVWAYLRFSNRRVSEERREEQLSRLEREVRERGAQRRQ
jgi:hypothetical protein